MTRMFLIDHKPIEGRINARLLTASFDALNVTDFSRLADARSFAERLQLAPDWILASQVYASELTEFLAWFNRQPFRTENTRLAVLVEGHELEHTTLPWPLVSRTRMVDHIERLLRHSGLGTVAPV